MIDKGKQSFSESQRPSYLTHIVYFCFHLKDFDVTTDKRCGVVVRDRQNLGLVPHVYEVKTYQSDNYSSFQYPTIPIKRIFLIPSLVIGLVDRLVNVA